MKKFYRNWKAICRINDVNLRMALSLVKDLTVLEGLRKGFPGCFSAKQLSDPMVPASVLRRRSYEASLADNRGEPEALAWDTELGWYNFNLLREFDIPKGPWWSDSLDSQHDPVPTEIKRQLVGQVIGCSMKVIWQGEEYLASYLCSDAFNDRDLGRIVTEEDMKEDLIMGLIPAKFIDLNS